MVSLRKQLRRLAKEEKKLKAAMASAATMKPADYLPTNPRFEGALSVFLDSHRDKRAHLSMMQQFLKGRFISLGSPIGDWDSLDMKPQVFSLDQYFALPIFSSLTHLQTFCAKFQLSVRDPKGDLWADWRIDSKLLLAKNLPDEVEEEEEFPIMTSSFHTTSSAEGGDGAFTTDGTPAASRVGTSSTQDRLAQKDRFNFTKCTPLPIFGPLMKPYLYGYFADLPTVVDNISIVPDKVDLIVNPGSHLEFVVSRSVTDLVAARDRHVLHHAYQEVEKELRAEFGHFFRLCCPEVEAALSFTMPQDSIDAMKAHELQYDIVMLVSSEHYEMTYEKLRVAKAQGKLAGHASLQILELCFAEPHLVDSATPFYTRAGIEDQLRDEDHHHQGVEGEVHVTASSQSGSSSTGKGGFGAFRALGGGRSVLLAGDVKPGSTYLDNPANRQLAPHTVATFRHGVRG